MKTKIKAKVKVAPFSVAKYLNGIVFFCRREDGNDIRIAICRDNDSQFEIIEELKVFNEKGREEGFRGCSNFHIFNSEDQWYLVYSRRYSGFLYKETQMVIAKSSDMINFVVIDRESDQNFETMISISNHQHRNHFLAYFGTESIRAAASPDLKNWHSSGKLLDPRKDNFDCNPLHVIDAIKTNRGILVLYESKPKKKTETKKLVIGGALFSTDQPYKILWRSPEALFKKTFTDQRDWPEYLGLVVNGENLETYWLARGGKILVIKIKALTSGIGAIEKRPIHLNRHHNNPIIKPKAENNWEYDATFNPAAVNLEDKIHLIYRAIGANGVSVLGYASSEDGFSIKERLAAPIFAPRNFSQYSKNDQAQYPSKYISGGSWVGCEDPRITQIEEKLYMTYTSFDGSNPPGVALTWISVKDFLRKKWTWKRPILISKPGEIQKNWMLFPEKINGKYAILHSITPHISIEYVDDLEAEGLVIESRKNQGKDEKRWDNIVRGAGSPPIKTEHGWLVLYHAMDKKDPNRYKVGAMILDYNDPIKILFRANCPILEPNESYENEGAKAGVVYVCGAVIKDGTLFVYYGGSDSVVCVATAEIKEFLKDLSCQVANDPVIRKKVIPKKRKTKKISKPKKFNPREKIKLKVKLIKG